MTERTSPSSAAVPTQRNTKRPSKRPNIMNESPVTVRLQPSHSNVVKLKSQPGIEYTVYTFHVNIIRILSY